MSDTPRNQFLYEFGINEKRARDLICRVTQIVAKNIQISNESGSDVLRCDLDKSGCVWDIVQYIEREDLSTVDAQWMFYAFGAATENHDQLREIARAEHTARELFAALNPTVHRVCHRKTTQEE